MDSSYTTVRSKKDTGLVVGWIVLVILLIAAVAGGVWYWQQMKVKDLRAKNEGLQTQVSDLQKQVSASSSQDTATNEKVKLAELNLAIALPSDIKDLKYVNIDTSKQQGSFKILAGIAISTSSLEGKSIECAADKSALGQLVKVEGQRPDSATMDNSFGALVKQYDDYYVAYQAPQSACSQDKDVEQLQASQISSFKSALSSLEEAQ